MSAKKICDSCDTEAPLSAARCKDCMEEFAPKKPMSFIGPLVLLGLIAVSSFAGAATLYRVSLYSTESPILVNSETQSINYVTMYRSGPVTRILPWEKIDHLEFVITSNNTEEIVAIDLDGERWPVDSSAGGSILQKAEYYSELIGRPLKTVDNSFFAK